MSEQTNLREASHQALVGEIREYTRRELAQVGQRLARCLAHFVGAGEALASGLGDPSRDALLPALAFAERFAHDVPPAVQPPPAAHPLLRWVDADQCPRSEPYPCPYLPGRLARQRGFRVPGMPGPLYHELMDRGFRRSGDVFYAMECPTCRRCVQIRVPVADFVHPCLLSAPKFRRFVWLKHA